MRATTTIRTGPVHRATRRPPGRLDSHKNWTDRRGLVKDRIAQELAHTERYLADTTDRLKTALKNLDTVLELAGDCYRTYSDADDKVRRMCNQAFFEAVYVREDDESVASKLAPPFELIVNRNPVLASADQPSPVWEETDQELVDLIRATKQPTTAFAVMGCDENYLVGRVELEPTTHGLRDVGYETPRCDSRGPNARVIARSGRRNVR
jgi:hypothetical protein